MKDVCFKFYNIGYNQVNVILLDKCNNRIFCGKTCNGYIKVRLKCFEGYKVIANNGVNTIYSSIYVNSDTYNYSFSFNNESNIITFLLKDENYNNLLIEKGKLFLWQKQ